MNTEIQLSQTISRDLVPQTVFKHLAGNGLQLANQAGGIINLTVVIPGDASATPSSPMQLSDEYYNLFVVHEDYYDDSSVLVPKDRALTQFGDAAAEFVDKYGSFTPEAIAVLKTYPCIFANENHQYGKTDDDHMAYLGIITRLRVQDTGIKVYFQKLSEFPQQRLNDIAYELGIKKPKGFNDLNRTHWLLKQIPLIEELDRAGIPVQFNQPS